MKADQVANWMIGEVKRRGSLYPATIAYDIAWKFGKQFTYENENGNLTIRIDVLTAFRKLTKDSVVWEPQSRCWRKRWQSYAAGKQQN